MRKPYDGSIGGFKYRAGRTAGCWNIFKRGRHVLSVTASELKRVMKRQATLSTIGAWINLKGIRQEIKDDWTECNSGRSLRRAFKRLKAVETPTAPAFCSNCEAEAVARTDIGTPICHTCRTAYEWGGGAPKEL